TGVKGSSISWDFESEDANNSLINLTTGAVTVPSTGQVTISLVATISNATFTFEKVFSVTLGEGDPLPINTIRNQGNGSFVKTVGVITSIYRNQDTTFFFIEDASGAVMVEALNSQTVGFVVGD